MRWATLLCGLALASGCDKQQAAPPPTKTQPPLSAGAVAHDAAPGSLRQMISRPGAANELREFGRFYVMYNTERNKSPSKLEDLKPYMERDAKTLLEAIKDGYYVVVWNVRELSSNTLLAYEKTPDGNGDHLVVMGDGSVSKLNDQQLQKSLKGQ